MKVQKTVVNVNPFANLEYVVNQLNLVVERTDLDLEVIRKLEIESLGVRYAIQSFEINYDTSHYPAVAKVNCTSLATGLGYAFDVTYQFLESYFTRIVDLYRTKVL